MFISFNLWRKWSLCWVLFVFFLSGRYRTQLWDKQAGSFLPSTPGLGMHVEIKDPETNVACLCLHSTFQTCLIYNNYTNTNASLLLWNHILSLFISDHSVPSVWIRWTFHLHVPHTRRASDLPSLQLHQDGTVCWRKTGTTVKLMEQKINIEISLSAEHKRRYFWRMSVIIQLMDPVAFHSFFFFFLHTMEVNGVHINCLVTFFCVQQKKEMLTGLDQLEGEINYIYSYFVILLINFE